MVVGAWEMVAAALQRVLEVDWERTVAELAGWAADADPLVVRAAAAAVAEPRLLVTGGRSTAVLAVQRRAVASLAAVASRPAPRRGLQGAAAGPRLHRERCRCRYRRLLDAA